jgi:hypothetical protein
VEKKYKITLIATILMILMIILIAISILSFFLYQKNQKNKEKKPIRQHYVEKVALPSIKINDVDELGNTPLHIACKYNHEAITIYCINRVVIESTEPSTEKILSEYLNKKNIYGETPLHLAVKNPSKDALQVILRNRAVDINVQNDRGETPLHLAIRSEEKEIIELLLKKNADITIKDKNGDDARSLAKKMKLKIKFPDNQRSTITDSRSTLR